MEAGADDSSSPAAWIAQVDASLSSLSSLFAPTFGGVGSGCSLIVDGVGSVLMGGSGMQAADTALSNARHAARQSASPTPAVAAQMMLKSLKEHEAVSGDGCAAAAIVTAGAWTQIRRHIGAAGAGSSVHAASAMEQATRRSRVRILRGLQQLRSHWIDSLALRDWIREDGRCTRIACADIHAIDAAALALVRTQLSSSLTAAAASTLSQACIELLSACRRTPLHSLATVTEQLLQDDGRCIVQCASLPLSDTRVMHGLLISGARWARPDMHGLLAEASSIRTLCLLGPLPPSTGEATVESQSAQGALSFLQSREREAERWVDRMKAEGIRLLLTTRALQPSVLAALFAAGIAAVQSLDEDDLRRLAAYAGTRALSSLSSFSLPADSSAVAAESLPCGSFAAVVQVRVGADNMMHFEVDDSRPAASTASLSSPSSPPPLSNRPHTLLLCAASQGMCKQYASMMMRALRMLRCWARDIDSSSSSLCVVGGGCSVELALMLFCEDAARCIELGTAMQHPLFPPPSQSQLSVSDAAFSPQPSPPSNRALVADLPGALRAVAAGLSSVVQCLLSNALPAVSAGAAAGVERVQQLPWIKMQPCLRVLLHDQSGTSSLGFVYAREGIAASYTPLHLRSSLASSESASARIQRQLRVARAESALVALLPPLVSLQDTRFVLSSTASSPAASSLAAACAAASTAFLPLDSVASKVALLSFLLQQCITLLRIDGSASVRSGRNGGGLIVGGPPRHQRGRVRPARSAVDEGEEDSDEEQSDESESDAEN